MSQSKKILNENLNLIKLFMNYDSSKTLAENKGRKRILKEDTFDTPQEITIKNFYDKCGEHSGNGLISKSDIETIAATFNKAFAYQTWGMGGTDDSESTGWRSVLSQMTKGNYADACRIADSYVEFTNYSGGFQKALIDELDDEELAEFYITLVKMKNNTSETKKEESSDKSVGTGAKSTSSKEYDSKTHWVKNETAWQTLLQKLQWMSKEYFGGGKITITEFWVAVDQVKFHKVKQLGSFAEANCGAKANPASGGQYNGEDLFSFKLKGTNIDAPITDFVTFYLRCEGGNKVETLGTGGKPETQQTQQKTTQTQQKTTQTQQTQTQQKPTQQKPKVTFTECSNTYSYGCRSEKIEEAQKCLKDQGLYSYTVDGKFGSKTLKSIKSKLNKTYFTDSDITAICGRKQEERKSDPESTPGGGGSGAKEEDYVWNGIMI